MLISFSLILGLCSVSCSAGDLLLPSNRVAEVRSRVASCPDAHVWWTNLTARLDARMSSAPFVPESGGQWYNYYFCKTCNELLKTESSTCHRCAKCGKTYTGWPYDDAALTIQHMNLAQNLRDAGLAYRISGEQRFADFARCILLDYAKKRPHYKLHDNWGKQHPTLGGYVTSQSLDDAVWLIRVIQGYDAIRSALSEADSDLIAKNVLIPESDFLLSVDRNSNSIGNHECWHAAAVGLVGLALDRLECRDESKRRILRQLERGVDANGAWREGAWGYHFYTMNALMNYFVALHNCGEKPPEAFHRMFHAPLGQVLSGWRLPANGDTAALHFSPGARPDLYLPAAHFWPEDEKIVSWSVASDKGSEYAALWGVPTSELGCAVWQSEVSRDSGMAVLRAGRCDDGSPKTSLAFDFGSHGGWHGHCDKLSYEIGHEGTCVSDDPGCGNYAQPLHWAWIRQTLAHNTVSVDSRGQRPCQGKLLSFQSETNGMSVVRASAEIAEGVTMTRAVALAGDVVLELTEVKSDAEHVYDWSFHASGDFKTPLSMREVSLGEKTVRDKLQPENWDGSEAYTWLEGVKKSGHAGSWTADWSGGKSRVNVKQVSANGELFSGLGWGDGGKMRESVVFNRVRGTSALFATVIDLGSHNVGDIRMERANGVCVPRMHVLIDGQSRELALRTIGSVLESGMSYRADRETYEILPADCEMVDCPATYIQDHRPRRVAFHLKGLKDVTLDFGGATVLLHGKIQPFLMENCTNVTVENVSVRFARTPYTQGTVISRTERSLRVNFGPEFPVCVKDETLYFVGDGWQDGPIRKRPCFMQFFDPETRDGRTLCLAFFAGKISADEMPTDFPWAKNAPQFTPRVEDGAIVLESDRALSADIRSGDVFVIEHAKRDHSSFEMVDCSDMTIRNYRIVNGLGMGIFPFHCHNVSLDGVKMFCDENSPSIIANSADGIHAFACSGDFVVTNCVIEGTIDDALNVHGNYYIVHKAQGSEIVAFTGLQPEGTTAIFRPGDRIAVCKGHTLDKAAEYTLVSMRPLDTKHVALTVDRPVLPHAEKDIIENLSAQCHLKISNSRFGKSNSHLRLQTRGGIVVENCETELPIWLTGDMNYWYESSPCDNLIIRNTRFIGGKAVIRSCPEFTPTEEHPYYHGDVLVESCIFDAASPFFAQGVRHMTVRDCRTVDGKRLDLDSSLHE